MKLKIEQLICDECGVKKSRNIEPAQYGGADPFEGWIVNVNNCLDFCSAKCAEKHFRLWREIEQNYG